MIVGGLTVMTWSLTGYEIYEMVPGFLFGSLTIILVSVIGKAPSKEITEEYDKVVNNL